MMKGTALALVSGALLMGLLFYPQSGAEVTVVSLSHSPANPTPDDEVTVTIQLTNSSEVNKTYISWCQSTPVLCYVPKEMKYIGDDAYSFKLGKNVDGQEMKYNVTIFYKNGTSSVTETIHFSVHKPSNGGNNNNTTNNNTNTTDDGKTDPAGQNYLPYIAIAVVIVIAVVALLAFMTRKKPGSP